MKKNRLHIVLCLATAFLAAACKPTTIQPKATIPVEYVLAWEERYGAHYDSIPYHVVALDLYSEGLSLDTAHHMQGTGYNLYLSDIFVPEDSLEAGTYRSLQMDKYPLNVKPYTFLPGHDYEGTPTGIYLLHVENGKLQSIQVFDSGTMVVRDTTNGLTDIRFTLPYKGENNADATYECHFQGKLQPWPKQ